MLGVRSRLSIVWLSISRLSISWLSISWLSISWLSIVRLGQVLVVGRVAWLLIHLGECDRADEPIASPLEIEIPNMGLVVVLQLQSPSTDDFIDADTGHRLNNEPLSRYPGFEDFGLGMEQVAVGDNQIGERTWPDAADDFADAEQLGGMGRDRGEGIFGGQAPLNRTADLSQKFRRILKPIAGQTDLDSGLDKASRVFGCQVPMHQVSQGHLHRPLTGSHIGSRWEIDGDQNRAAGTTNFFQTLIFASRAAEHKLQGELPCDTVCPNCHPLVGSIGDESPLQHHFAQSLQGTVRLGPR